MVSRMYKFRKVLCFAFIAVLMLQVLTLTAFADDRTKTVTVDQSYTYIITPAQFPSYMGSPSSYVPATYNYNDGTYKGTLSLSYAACSAPISVGSNLQVTIYTKYTGTVTAPAESKTITYSTSYSFTITPAQFSNYMSSPASYVPSTYNYNDGSYHGTLNLTRAACSAPTAVGNYLQVTIFTDYSGTVYYK